MCLPAPGEEVTVVHREFPAGAGEVKVWAGTEKPGVLQITYRSRTVPVLISSGDYGRLLDIQKKLSHPRMRTVILVRTGARLVP